MGVFGSLREGRARRRGPDGRRRARAVLASLVLVSSAVPIFAATTGSSAAAPLTSPTYSNKMLDSGFPTWFEDVNGVRVEACLDPTDLNCLAPLTGPGFNADQPLSFPTNFPEEFFYSAADSEPIQVADCAAGIGDVSVHLALEAAFINGAPARGDQMVFGRIRIVAKAGSGLCGSTWYTFRTPYGDLTVQTEPDGTIRGGIAAANTVDIGCFPSPVKPCNFNESLAAPVLAHGLLTQAADAVNGPAVPGYLGNGTFDLIDGGLGGVDVFEVLKWPADATPPAGFGVSCADGCTPVGSTDKFQLLAKVAGPLEATKDVIDFGGVEQNTTSAPLTATVANLGSGVLGLDPTTTLGPVTLTDPSGQFALGANTCENAVLARSTAVGSTCGIDVTFTPNGLGLATATLTVTDVPADVNTPARPKTITLRGTGVVAGATPKGSVDQATLFFPETRITTLSDPLTITVSNPSADGATAPLLVQPGAISDPNFLVSYDGCSATYVPVDGTCQIDVRFKPGVPKGLKAGVLDLVTNNPTAMAVGLNGTATGGIATESPNIDQTNSFPEWYQDERGVRVGQCDNPANLKCIAAPLPVAGAPQSFPGNYPDEWFYYIMQSDAVAFTDEACLVGGELTTVSGDLSIEVAAEAAFLGPIEFGGGITFGRVRVVARDLCPETTYVIEHPYGVLTLATNDLGAIKPNMSTVDVGCLGSPCDYHEAISAVVFEGFLTQSNRSPGYLGDPVVPGTVTGAPYQHGGPEFNKVTVTKAGDAAPLGETDQFMVSGRLVGPMVADPTSIRFADQTMLTPASTPRAVKFTNQGSVDDVTLAGPSVTLDGADASDFTFSAGDCLPGVVLAPGQFCTAYVSFHPATPGEKAATLTLHHSGKNDPLEVQLSGLALSLAGTAAITPSLRTVQFVDRHLGDASEIVRVQLSNAGGDEPLAISGLDLPAGDFHLVDTTCVVNPTTEADVVPVGGSCELALQYVPTVAGPAEQVITITSNAVAPTDVITITLKGRGSGANAAQAGTQNMGGFPSWIQDRNGIRMEDCLVNDGHCVLLADATFNPSVAVSFPNNFPTESFYTLADSDIVNVPAHVCAAGVTAAGGTAQLRIATEAAFTSPSPTAGAQNMFNRIRVTASGLCPNTTYTFTHPYGTISFTADGNGDIRPKAGTFDQDGVLTTFPVTSFLRWDPNSGPAAPAGYVGSYATLHKLVGGTYRPNGTDVVNFFAVSPFVNGAPGPEVARTDLFNLAGRIAGPVVMNPSVQSFGTFEVGTLLTVEEFSFSVSNIGVEDAHVTNVALSGANAADFEVTGGTCSGATLARDTNCVVVVRFKGSSTTGTKSATLTVTTDASRPTVTAALSATVIPVQTPSLTVSPASFALGSLPVGAPSAVQTISVKNSGTGYLTLNPTTGFTASNAVVTVLAPVVGGNQACAANLELGPLAICDVRFTVTPVAKGAVSVSYRAEAHDTTADHVENHVNLTGNFSKTVGITATGVQATITASATSLSVSARSTETKNVKVTLTNTGTANFSLLGAPAIEVVDQVLGSGASSKFTPLPTHNCNNIIPGKSCQVTINFTPGAGSTAAPGNTYQVYVYLYGNASNLGSKASGTGLRLSVTGTRAR